MTDPPVAPAGNPPPMDGEARAPVFERPPLVVRFLDQTEEQIRSRLAKLGLFRRLFLLERDWMTRITMLMVILAIFWGGVGGFDAFGWRTQVTAWALGQTLHLSNQEIYSSITLHGIRMLFGFAQQLEMAIFGVLLINALGLTPRHKWVLYLTVFVFNLGIIFLQGPFYLLPQFNDNYFPALGWYFLSPLGIRGLSGYVVSPLWYAGWILICGAVFLWTGWMLVHFRDWWKAHGGARGTQQLPAFMLFVLATLILIPLSYITVLGSSAWDLLNYLGVGPVAPLFNQVEFWFFGHGLVYLLFLIPVTTLYLLVPIFAKRPIYSYRFAYAAAVLFTILTPILGIHHLYLTPLPAWSTWLTMVLSFLIIVPSAITFFSVWMTLKGVRARDWEWNGVTLFLLLSFAGSIAGGLTGPDNATIGFDVDLHNTLFVVSHFHAITLLSITAGGFALTYALFPILVGRLWRSAWLARLHFVFTTIGMAGMVLTMDLLGTDGILRRELIFPRTAMIDNLQVLLTGFIVVALLAQLFLLANAVLTLFRGELLSAAGLSFDETVRRAARSTHPRPTVPIDDVPFIRRVPRTRREGAERAWTAVVALLIAGVLVASSPFGLSVGTSTSTPATNTPAGTEFVTLTGHQYYWSVQESGAIQGAFDNVVVVQAGQWVAINATAIDATEGVYLPSHADPMVNVQVVPGSWSYALFQAPEYPGVYGVPNSEYNGPWFGQDVAALVVLPSSGTASSLSAFTSSHGASDIYDPPVVSAEGARLTADQEGLFDHSVPGPTLSAPAGHVAFSWTVPLASIGIDSYLVNVTTNDPNGQIAWLAAHNNTLPYHFGIYRLTTTSGLETVTETPLVIGPVVNESISVGAGVYLYGLVTPIPYVYNPDGQSTWMTGEQTGSVMGLWGVLWVSP